MIKVVSYVLGLLLAGAGGWYLGTQYQPDPPQATGEVLATVNGVSYGKDWFIEHMKLRGGNRPGQYQDTEQKQALLEYLLSQEVLYMQAKAQGLDQTPAIDRLMKQTVVDKFLEDNLNQKVAAARVTDEEVRAHFEDNRYVYNKPARRRGAMILMERKSADSDEVWQQKKNTLAMIAEQVAQLDENTLHFGDLAKAHSEDRGSKYQGGVIGWLIQHPSRKYKWDDAVVDALFDLQQPGDVSPIIETENQLYLVRLVAAEDVKEKAFDQVKAGIKNQLLQAKKQQIRADFMQSIQQQADIEIDMKMLAAIPAFSPPEEKPLTPPALPGGNGGKQ